MTENMEYAGRLGGWETGKLKAKKGLRLKAQRRAFGRWRLEAEKLKAELT
jgi:hypothetical protein